MVHAGTKRSLANELHRVEVRMTAELIDTDADTTYNSRDLIRGDGMGMGNLFWIEKDSAAMLPYIAPTEAKQVTP